MKKNRLLSRWGLAGFLCVIGTLTILGGYWNYGHSMSLIRTDYPPGDMGGLLTSDMLAMRAGSEYCLILLPGLLILLLGLLLIARLVKMEEKRKHIFKE